MFNEAARQLKNLIKEVKNCMFQQHLQNLTATEETGNSLWKATKKNLNSQYNITPQSGDNIEGGLEANTKKPKDLQKI
jgi:hypothetical protein